MPIYRSTDRLPLTREGSRRSYALRGGTLAKLYSSIPRRRAQAVPTVLGWIEQYYDWEPFRFDDTTGIWVDWVPGSEQPVVVTSDYFSDMASQMFSWESLAYIEWWGN